MTICLAEQKILQLLSSHKEITSYNLAEELNPFNPEHLGTYSNRLISLTKMHRHLDQLQALDLVKSYTTTGDANRNFLPKRHISLTANGRAKVNELQRVKQSR